MDALQQGSKRFSSNHHLSHLEGDSPGMGHHLRPDLDHLDLQTAQRPAPYHIRQSQLAQEVAQVAGQNEKLQPHLVSHELVAANKGKMALERGPLVYCAEQADNPGGILNLTISKEDTFEYAFDPGLFSGLGKIEGNAVSRPGPFTAIPYYAWAHREIGEMAVWLVAE